MEAVYDYIEAYFKQTLSGEERKNFEARCVSDRDFANDVAFYLASRQAIRQALLEQKQKLWTGENDTNKKSPAIAAHDKIFLRQWLPYAAAACIVLATAMYFLFKAPSPQKLANDYVQKNYLQLSLTMAGMPDSLQTAIADYNNKDYNNALLLLEALEKNHPDNSDEKKYAGLVCLVTKNYDKALRQFYELAKMKGLFSNDGNFLKAITLLQRDAPGDKEQAKQLLQQVVDDNAAGSEEAREWLKNF